MTKSPQEIAAWASSRPKPRETPVINQTLGCCHSSLAIGTPLGVSSLHLPSNHTALPLWVLPLTQIKCSFQNTYSDRKTVRAADCVLHSPRVIAKSGITEHLI